MGPQPTGGRRTATHMQTSTPSPRTSSRLVSALTTCPWHNETKEEGIRGPETGRHDSELVRQLIHSVVKVRP
jgi:hypothetical protein